MISIISLFIILTLKQTTQLEIYADNPNNGLIFTPEHTINVKEKNYYLLYTFDVTTFQYVLSWKNDAMAKCNNSEIKFDSNILWNKPIPEKNFKKDNKRINMTLLYIERLNNNLNEFQSRTNECNALLQISNNFNIMNVELNKLANLDTNSIENILSLTDISLEINNILIDFENKYTLPFSLSYEFKKNFFNYSHFELYMHENVVTLAFGFPLYKQNTLYNVYKKPIIYENEPYILRNIGNFSIIDNNIRKFFNSDPLKNNCTKIIHNYFCEKPILESICNETYNSSKCLIKLPKRNIITKVNKKFFISIFHPVIIDIICETGSIIIRLDSHAKIINNMNCIIDTPLFRFDPKNQRENITYFMKIAAIDPGNTIKFYLEKFESIGNYITIGYIVFLIATYFATIYLSIKRSKGIIEKIDSETEFETTSSIHIYATIDE